MHKLKLPVPLAFLDGRERHRYFSLLVLGACAIFAVLTADHLTRYERDTGFVFAIPRAKGAVILPLFALGSLLMLLYIHKKRYRTNRISEFRTSLYRLFAAIATAVLIQAIVSKNIMLSDYLKLIPRYVALRYSIHCLFSVLFIVILLFPFYRVPVHSRV